MTRKFNNRQHTKVLPVLYRHFYMDFYLFVQIIFALIHIEISGVNYVSHYKVAILTLTISHQL
jgi:uncharacterized membrane protein